MLGDRSDVSLIVWHGCVGLCSWYLKGFYLDRRPTCYSASVAFLKIFLEMLF